ncbi:MAG: DUF3298 domain-containing protein [Alistipes sp.]|nr:DUF3298 domain-containing protein [Alistipes sp.]
MKNYRFLAFIWATLSLIGCNNIAKPTLPEFETFTYEVSDDESYTVKIAYQRIKNIEDSDIFAKIEMQNYLNSFEGHEAMTDSTPEVDLEASAKLLVEEYAGYAFEGGPMCWYSMDQTSFFVRDNTVLCYETLLESYTGGVHGGSALWYECFDLATGGLYDFGYLLDGEWEAAIKELIYAKLTSENNIIVESAEHLPPFSTATLSEQGVVIVYQPYEVASFDEGIIAVEISDAEISAAGAPLLWE